MVGSTPITVAIALVKLTVKLAVKSHVTVLTGVMTKSAVDINNHNNYKV